METPLTSFRWPDSSDTANSITSGPVSSTLSSDSFDIAYLRLAKSTKGQHLCFAHTGRGFLLPQSVRHETMEHVANSRRLVFLGNSNQQHGRRHSLHDAIDQIREEVPALGGADNGKIGVIDGRRQGCKQILRFDDHRLRRHRAQFTQVLMKLLQ